MAVAADAMIIAAMHDNHGSHAGSLLISKYRRTSHCLEGDQRSANAKKNKRDNSISATKQNDEISVNRKSLS